MAHRNDEALVIFKQLQSSSNPEIASQSKQAVQNLSGTGNTPAKKTFADVYSSPSYEGRYDTTILPLKIRYGRYLDKTIKARSMDLPVSIVIPFHRRRPSRNY